jgi:hypothetical protein
VVSILRQILTKVAALLCMTIVNSNQELNPMVGHSPTPSKKKEKEGREQAFRINSKISTTKKKTLCVSFW